MCIFFLLSCDTNNKVSEGVKETATQVERPIQLSYYKCDYSKREYDTILSSGDEHTTTEVWGIDKRYIDSLPSINIHPVDTTAIIKSAAFHLRKRFPDIAILYSDCKLEHISEKDTSNPNNWFFDISFLYDKRGYYQKVPVLLDGRIVLSNNE